MSEIEYGYCHCGCGQKTKISPETNKAKGWVKGVARKYINHHNAAVGGEHSPRWKGGHRKLGNGYIRVHTGLNTSEFAHRLNAAAENGGELPEGAIVHHTNGKADNSSFVVCRSHSEHRMIHVREQALAACGHEDWRKCYFCHEWDAPENLTYIKSNRSSYHKKCAAEHVAAQRLRWKSEGKKRKS